MAVSGPQQIGHFSGFPLLFSDLEQGSGDPPDHLLQKAGSDQPDPDHGVAGLIQILTGKGGHRESGNLGLEQGPDCGFPRVSSRGLEDFEVMLADQEGNSLLHGDLIQATVDPPGNIPPLGEVGRPLQKIITVLLPDGRPLCVELLRHAHGLHDPDVAREQRIQAPPEDFRGEPFRGQSKVNHLTECIHSGVRPTAPDHSHRMVCHFGQGSLHRFLQTRKTVLTPFLDFLALPPAIVPADVRDPECVLHTRQISKRNPA